MTSIRHLRSLAAAAGLAAAALVGPMAAGASASEPAATAPAAPAAMETFGPYSSEGTCNYWRYAVAATGRRTDPCHRFPAVGEYWFFQAY